MSAVLRCCEQKAANFLRGKLGGEIRPRDEPGARPGTHDFDLELPDGSVIAVEVTRVTNPDVLKFLKTERNWRAPTLSKTWIICVPADVRINQLRSKIEPLLEQLERQNIYEFGFRKLQSSCPAIIKLDKLGVKGGKAFSWPSAAEIQVTLCSEASAISTDFLSEAVEQETKKKDNLDKLKKADSNEKHMVIWVDFWAHEVSSAVDLMEYRRPRPPTVPCEIDVVWVMSRSGRKGMVVWRFNKRDNEWCKV